MFNFNNQFVVQGDLVILKSRYDEGKVFHSLALKDFLYSDIIAEMVGVKDKDAIEKDNRVREYAERNYPILHELLHNHLVQNGYVESKEVSELTIMPF